MLTFLRLFMLSPQNVPQVIIQMWYMSTNGVDDIALVSALFSLLSIVVTVFAVVTQKLIMKEQQFVIIQFDVLAPNLKSDMRRNINHIRNEIAAVLMVDKHAIDIEKAQYLGAGTAGSPSAGNGFHFRMHVDVNSRDENATPSSTHSARNEDGSEEINHRDALQKVIDNGSLPMIFKKYWKLQQIPVIQGLDVERVRDREKPRESSPSAEDMAVEMQPDIDQRVESETEGSGDGGMTLR